MLRLLTLGGLSIERDGRPLDHLSGNRKGLALLAVLAVHGKVGRDRLMAILWPESDGERARGSLKQTVHSLRRQLAEPDLLLGMTELRLNPDRIEADVQLFSLALERGDAEEAASLYTGPFLDGVYLDGTAEFEHWLDGRRDELASRHREALESLAVAAGARGDLAAEVAWWRRLQGADPLNSRAALRLMEALERSGDRAAALRHAQAHERLLLEELGVSLDPTVAEFVERLRTSSAPWVSEGSAGSDSAGDRARQAGPETLPLAGASTPNTGRRQRPLLQAGGLQAGGLQAGGLQAGGFLAGGILLALGALAAGLLFTNARAGSGPDGEGSLLAGGAGPSPLASVAVLPFLDLSPDRNLEYLADGIAEEILNSLAGIQEIRVPARTSSFSFKGRNLPIGEIARQLSVDHVLEGSLRTDGDRIRVTAQLIDARTDQHLWSRNFEPEFDDTFAVQDEIARTVAQALRVRLAPGAEASFHPPTGDPAAHDLYLRGLFHWNRRSAPDLLLAIQFFTEATERDPGYARAWAGLALVYAVIPIGFIPPLPTDLARARLEEAADRALALDPTLSEVHAAVHAARGLSYHFEWRWDDAEREYLRAIDLNPRHATAHQWYGEHQAKSGRAEGGVASLRRALELDPLSLVIRNDLGLALLLGRRFDEAREVWEATVAMDPSFAIPHFFLHRLGLIEGKLEASEEAGRRWVALTGAATVEEISLLTRAVGTPDLRPAALAVLDNWATAPEPRWLDIAFYSTQLGAHDRAIDALEEGLRARAPMMVQLGHIPWFDPLRNDPRFAAVAREVGFP